MKTNNKLKRAAAFLLTATVLFATSCKKDQDNNPSGGDAKLIKTQTDANSFTTYEYNTSGAISKINFTEEGVTGSMAVAYANNKISTVTGDEVKFDFTYNGNNVSKIVTTVTDEESDQYGGETTFTYANNRLSESIFTAKIGEDTWPMTTVKYEYLANGDIKKKNVFLFNVLEDKWELSETTTYEYDDKKNPMYAISAAYYGLFQLESAHNVTKEVITDENGAVTTTATYAYTYNSKGYPTKVVINVNNAQGGQEPAQTTTFTYQ